MSKAGDNNYRAYVGDPENYDLIAAISFNLLTTLGLRQQHSLLDVGCGSLRNGRLFLPYLQPGKYAGIEPNQWLVEEGIANELGADLIRLKKPFFTYRTDASELPAGMSFDYVLLQSIFSHCGKELIDDWLEQLLPRLNEGGMIVCTYQRAQVDSGESGWVYPGLVRYTEASFRAIAEAHGLYYKWLDWPHPIQKWCVLTRDQGRIDYIERTGLSLKNTIDEHLGRSE